MAARARNSELELYLSSRATEGRVDSQGEFTIARSEALKKLAGFQLPFADAWVVKLVQAVVAGGSTKPIRVDLGATVINFYFLEPGFDLDALEAGFFNPEPSSNRSLRHLLSGLWAVGLGYKWGFQVAFPNQAETLIWDGSSLSRVKSAVQRDCVCITVAPLERKASLSWVAGVALSGKRNAELLLSIKKNCYTCPLALSVDGRRVDALQNAEIQGWSDTSFPIWLGVAKLKSPEFKLPRGTFEKRVGGSGGPASSGGGGGWAQEARDRMAELKPVRPASLAYIVSVHMKLTGSGKTRSWAEHREQSMAYWILDGVIVGTDKLLSERLHCSLGCFLSAEGLETDLTTLSVVASEERKKRIAHARQSLFAATEVLENLDFHRMIEKGKSDSRLVGWLMIGGGVLALVASPTFGLALGAVGVVSLLFAGSTQEGLSSSAGFALRNLRRKLVSESKSKYR